MRGQFRIGVFGISGIGKSSLIQRTMGHLPQKSAHLQASALIKRASTEQVTNDSLRTATPNDIQVNQELMIKEYRKELDFGEEVQVVIFDGHSVIDNDEEIVEISPCVIRELQLHCLAFIKEPPETIYRRRTSDTSRSRPPRSIDELRDLQKRALVVCQRYHQDLRLPLHIISSSDDKLLASFISTGISDVPEEETN